MIILDRYYVDRCNNELLTNTHTHHTRTHNTENNFFFLMAN